MINGVGSGGTSCEKEALIPIAMKFEDRKPTLDVFKANIAEGSGANLPAILGSESMQNKNSVLLLKQGKEVIAFPGPGGYKHHMVKRHTLAAYGSCTVGTFGDTM